MFEWMRVVTEEGRGLNARAHSLALVLVTFANYEGANCRPSTALIARRMGASRATVFRALDDLEGAGLIRRVLSHRHATTYELLMPEAVLGVTSETQEVSLGVTSATQGVSPVRPHLPNDQPTLEEDARELVSLIVELVNQIDAKQAARIRKSPKVLAAARAAAAAGRSPADLRAAWDEDPPGEIDSGPRFAEALLGRVERDERLPVKTKRAGRSQRGHTPTVPRTQQEFDAEAERLEANGGRW